MIFSSHDLLYIFFSAQKIEKGCCSPFFEVLQQPLSISFFRKTSREFVCFILNFFLFGIIVLCCRFSQHEPCQKNDGDYDENCGKNNSADHMKNLLSRKTRAFLQFFTAFFLLSREKKTQTMRGVWV